MIAEVAYSQHGTLEPSIDFDYEQLDEWTFGLPSDEINIDCLTALAGTGTRHDLETSAIRFLNLVSYAAFARRHALRVMPPIQVAIERSKLPWVNSAPARRIGEYLLAGRYSDEIALKAFVLLWCFAPFLLADECQSQKDVADLFGITKGCVSKQIAKMEQFFGLKTCRTNKKPRLRSRKGRG